MTGVLLLSGGYAMDRYIKRSPVFTLIQSHFNKKVYAEQLAIEDGLKILAFERAQGVRTSFDQAQELESVVSIVGRYTSAQDKIFVYPDMGSYYFFSKRDFVGRFPIGTLAWMREDWCQELIQSLNAQMPKLIILKVKLPGDYVKVYFKRATNKDNFNDVMRFIDAHYELIAMTPLSGVYLRKN